MDLQAASWLTCETGLVEPDEIPRTNSPVVILGKTYSALYDRDDIMDDVRSRLWFTYRKGFPPIGSATGPTTDGGWGCMLRCGQMMMAQALIVRHLRRDWRWHPRSSNNPQQKQIYNAILEMFLDKKGSTYSIHQLSSMGSMEGKPIGEWFGPNTIAQVFKKLSIYDRWSDVAMHVALDNTVIVEDILTLCKPPQLKLSQPEQRTILKPSNSPLPIPHNSCLTEPRDSDGDERDPNRLRDENAARHSAPEASFWRPLLLIIPLRLGLSELNEIYVSALKSCLTFSQSVGILGGKPNHAYWFFGFLDDEVLFLDPHTHQAAVDPTAPGESDDSFHCPYVSRMKIVDLDPSLAIGFFCAIESDFRELCTSIRKHIIGPCSHPMFELYKRRPDYWPKFEPYSPFCAGAEDVANAKDYDILDRQYECSASGGGSDEEFELL